MGTILVPDFLGEIAQLAVEDRSKKLKGREEIGVAKREIEKLVNEEEEVENRGEELRSGNVWDEKDL